MKREIITVVVCLTAVISVYLYAILKPASVVEASADIPANTVASDPQSTPSHKRGDATVDPSKIIEISQYPDYPTGCESVSLYILLRYYGVDVTLDDIINVLPKGPAPYEQDGMLFGADPNIEFVGDPRDASSYGVYCAPLAETANKFKEGAVGISPYISDENSAIDHVKSLLDDGIPAVVWLRNVEPNDNLTDFTRWTTPETGETVVWFSGEHAVVVYAYDADNYYCSDPMAGGKTTVAKEDFEYKVKMFGGMSVYYPEE